MKCMNLNQSENMDHYFNVGTSGHIDVSSNQHIKNHQYTALISIQHLIKIVNNKTLSFTIIL